MSRTPGGDGAKRKYVGEVTTTLALAGYSLRTVVPGSVAKLLGLREGDRLRWQLQAEGEGELVIVVRPLKAYRAPEHEVAVP